MVFGAGRFQCKVQSGIKTNTVEQNIQVIDVYLWGIYMEFKNVLQILQIED